MPYEQNLHTYLSRSDLWIGSQYSTFLQYERVSEGKLLHDEVINNIHITSELKNVLLWSELIKLLSTGENVWCMYKLEIWTTLDDSYLNITTPQTAQDVINKQEVLKISLTS